MRRLRLGLLVLALPAGADGLRDPPPAFVSFLAATRAAEVIDARCKTVGWDQQGYIWTSEQMWRALDAEGISRHHFRSEIRPLADAERDSALQAFYDTYGVTQMSADDRFCRAARTEAGRQTTLGSVLATTD